MKSKFVLQIGTALLVLSAFFSNSGCTWDKTYLFGNGGDGIKDSVCFQNEIQPIIASNCTQSGCHNAQDQAAGYDLSTYFSLMTIVKPGDPGKSKLMDVITGGGEGLMPPSPYQPLTQDQIALIQQWIIEGAGYNIDCGVSTPCDTTNITYTVTIAPIIQTNCLGCHSSSGTGGGVLLTTYAQVKDQVLTGSFLCAVNQESGCIPMPVNGSKLGDCELKKINLWVDMGMPQ